MLELHYWPTANGNKIALFLEEATLDYRVVPIHLSRGEQFEPDLARISPNNRIPAIVDQAPADGGAPFSAFESGAILLYLAERTGRILPHNPRDRHVAMQWLFWQVGGLGPMAGQSYHFLHAAPRQLPMERKWRACMASCTVIWTTAATTFAATNTASRTWPAIHGSLRTKSRASS
jgi:GST-like protein